MCFSANVFLTQVPQYERGVWKAVTVYNAKINNISFDGRAVVEGEVNNSLIELEDCTTVQMASVLNFVKQRRI